MSSACYSPASEMRAGFPEVECARKADLLTGPVFGYPSRYQVRWMKHTFLTIRGWTEHVHMNGRCWMSCRRFTAWRFYVVGAGTLHIMRALHGQHGDSGRSRATFLRQACVCSQDPPQDPTIVGRPEFCPVGRSLDCTARLEKLSV